MLQSDYVRSGILRAAQTKKPKPIENSELVAAARLYTPREYMNALANTLGDRRQAYGHIPIVNTAFTPVFTPLWEFHDDIEVGRITEKIIHITNLNINSDALLMRTAADYINFAVTNAVTDYITRIGAGTRLDDSLQRLREVSTALMRLCELITRHAPLIRP